MELIIFSVLIPILVNVVSYYIIKWLDGNNEDN